MAGIRTWMIAAGWLVVLPGVAGAQAVAFVPTVQTFPNGVTMSVTPVVSADRRYVRLGVSPQFTALEGIDPFLVPAAVTGGPGGGLAGGAGGLVGLAGMNGPIVGPFGAYDASPSRPGLGAGPQSAGTSPSDFEDRPWRGEGAIREAPAAPAPPPRATSRRGARAGVAAVKPPGARKARRGR